MKRRDHHHLKDDLIDLIRSFLYSPYDTLDSSDTDELADEIVKTCQEPISVEDRLPVDRTWVLSHYSGDNWGPGGAVNPGGQYWVVAQFIRGLSIADREALSDTHPLKRVWTRPDEYGNNQRPYCWNEFGPGSQFGQDVDYWMALPEIPTDQYEQQKKGEA